MTGKSLRFFGPPRLQVNSTHLEIKTRKGLALLAYLVVTNQPASRDRLATLLWPEYDQTRARANLRRTLYNLNQTPIGELLDAEQETIHFEAGDGTKIDVQQFAILLNRGDTQNRKDNLSQAIALYQDRFLTGFYLPDSEPFESWVTTVRERFQRQALEALAELSANCLENGDFKEAERHARRQLEIDNLQEPAWRQLMTVLDKDGRRAEALAEYDKCRNILWEELGVEPAPETAALAASLRTDSEPSEIKVRPTEVIEEGSVISPIPDSPSPYRGLFAFREVDAPYFFGREEFTELLTTTVAGNSIVAVIGPSGSGKSSVVYAGFLAEIRQGTNWVIASFRPGKRPFSALAAALVDHLSEDLSETARLSEIKELTDALNESQISFYDVVGRIRERHEADRLLLVADQFEELFTLGPDEGHRQQFLDTILELVFDQQFRQNPNFTLVLTLRADFTGQALAHRPLGDAIQEADVKLGPMTRAELRRAILNPARKLGVSFERGLVERILDDVGQEPGNLPLLEFALATLWEKQADGQMTHQAYEAVGRVDGALARHADEVFDGLTAEAQAQARRIFIQLVRPGEGTEDTRRLATRDELGEDWTLLHLLADARLVVTSRDAAGNETAEIVHEALIRSWGRLREWMETDRSFRVWQERLRIAVREWEELDRDTSTLLRGVALSTAESQMAERHEELSEAEKVFITSGATLRQEQEARRLQTQADRERLRRRFTLALGVGLVLSLILSVIALLQWRVATNERDAAEIARNAAESALARQLVAQSETLLDENLDLALLLAVEGVRRGDSPETRLALNRALEFSPFLSRFIHLGDLPDGGALLRGGLFPDGQVAVGGFNSFAIWDLFGDTQRPISVFQSHASTGANIALSPDGSTIATLGRKPTPFESENNGESTSSELQIQLFETSSGVRVQEFPFPPDTGFLIFSPDSRTLAAFGMSSIALWDIATGEQDRVLLGGNHPIISFSPDGKFIAAGGPGLILYIWDVERGEIVERLRGHESQIFATAFSPDGRILASSSNDGAIQFWDAMEWEPLGEALPAHNGSAFLQFSPNGQLLVSFDETGLLQRWLPSTQEKLGLPLRGHQPGMPLIPVFGPDGESIISAVVVTEPRGEHLQIIEWQLDRPPVLKLVGHLGDVFGAALDEETGIITSFDDDGEIRNWLQNGVPLSEAEQVEIDSSGNWWGLKMDPLGRFLIGGTQDGPVFVNDTQTGELIETLNEPPLPIAAFDFTSDGKLMAGAGCGEGSLVPQSCNTGRTWVWDTETWEVVARSEFEPFGMVHNDLALSPDGRLAAAGAFQIMAASTSREAVYLWDVATGLLLAEVEGRSTANNNGRFGLAIGPNNDLMSANSEDGFKLYEISEEGQLEMRFVWDDVEPMMEAAFSPDGRLLAAGDEQGTVYFWDVIEGELLRQEEVHNLQILSLQFVADGQFLLTTSRDNLVALADVNQLLGINAPETASAVETACNRANRNLTRDEWVRHFGDEPYRATCPDLPLVE